MIPDMTDDRFKKYKVVEIAEMLNLGVTKTRELLDANVLPVTKLGRQYFTSPKAIHDYLHGNIHKSIHF